MKCVINNVAFLEPADLRYLDKVSYYTRNDIGDPAEKGEVFFRYTDESSINYIDSRKDLVDYYDVVRLDDEELEDLITKTKRKLASYGNLWLKTYSERDRREVDSKRKEYSHKIETYTKYKDNRSVYDKAMKDNIKTLKLKMYYDEDDEGEE